MSYRASTMINEEIPIDHFDRSAVIRFHFERGFSVSLDDSEFKELPYNECTWLRAWLEKNTDVLDCRLMRAFMIEIEKGDAAKVITERFVGVKKTKKKKSWWSRLCNR